MITKPLIQIQDFSCTFTLVVPTPETSGYVDWRLSSFLLGTTFHTFLSSSLMIQPPLYLLSFFFALCDCMFSNMIDKTHKSMILIMLNL